MRCAHFHFLARNFPDRFGEIGLAPFGVSQFTRANEKMWCELQCNACLKMTGIVFDGAKELADFPGLDDCGVVCDARGNQRAAKNVGRVGLRTQRDDGIAKHATGEGSKPVRGFAMATRLNRSQRCKKLVGRDLIDRAMADPHSEQPQEPAGLLDGCRALRPSSSIFRIYSSATSSNVVAWQIFASSSACHFIAMGSCPSTTMARASSRF